MTRYGITDAAILARIDDLEGSLRMDQHRLKDAEELFTRAASLYEVLDARVDVARVRLNPGSHLQPSGECGPRRRSYPDCP